MPTVPSSLDPQTFQLRDANRKADRGRGWEAPLPPRRGVEYRWMKLPQCQATEHFISLNTLQRKPASSCPEKAARCSVPQVSTQQDVKADPRITVSPPSSHLTNIHLIISNAKEQIPSSVWLIQIFSLSLSLSLSLSNLRYKDERRSVFDWKVGLFFHFSTYWAPYNTNCCLIKVLDFTRFDHYCHKHKHPYQLLVCCFCLVSSFYYWFQKRFGKAI